MDYRSRSRRLPRKPRRARRLQAGAQWVPGRDGYPDGEAAPVESPPGWRRRQAEGALLSLADKAIEVMKERLRPTTPAALRAPPPHKPSGVPWLGVVGEGLG